MSVAQPISLEGPDRGRGGFRRDRYDRALILQPNGTFGVYESASKATKLLSDTTALELWQRTKSVRGVVHVDELVERVRALGAPWDDLDKAGKAELRAVFEAADVIAETHRAREEGTLTHDAWAASVLGQPFDPRFAPTVAAINAALAEAGLTPDPAYVEVALVNDELEMAGRCDALAARGDELFAVDLKTGSTVERSHIEHPGQLAAYAGGTLYDPLHEVRLATPAINQEIGYIIHAPAGTEECTIYRADLVAGRRACLLANAVRDLRRESKGWLTPVETSDPALIARLAESLAITTDSPVVPLERIEEEALALRGRLRAAYEAGARRFTWPAGVAKWDEGGPFTWAQLLEVERCVLDAEREVGAPFAEKLPVDPFQPPDLRLVGGTFVDGGVSPSSERPAVDTIEGCKAMHDALPTDLQQAAYGMAIAAGLSSDRRTWTEDQMPALERILQAATDEHGKRKAHVASTLAELEDEIVLLLVRAATDTPVQAKNLGATLESLTGDEAERVEALYDALGTSLGVSLDAPDEMRLVLSDLAHQHVLDAFGGSKAEALAAAKELATLHGRPKPRSVAAATSDPVLVSLLLAAS